jgi:hypothetical protein
MDGLIGIILIIIVTLILSPIIAVFSIPIFILGCCVIIIMIAREIISFLSEKKEIENNIFRIEYFRILDSAYRIAMIEQIEKIKIIDKTLIIETKKSHYVYEIENIKSMKVDSYIDYNKVKYKKLLLECQDSNTNKLFYIELYQDKGILNLNKNIDIIYDKLNHLSKHEENKIYYEEIDLSELILLQEKNILKAKEILLDKAIRIEAILTNIKEENLYIRVNLAIDNSKESNVIFYINKPEEKEKIKEYQLGDRITVNGIIEEIYDDKYLLGNVIIGKIEIEKKDKKKLENDCSKENLKIENKYVELEKKIFFLISNIKKWFSNLNKIQKIILILLILMSIVTKVYTIHSISLKEKEIEQIQKNYEKLSENKKNNNVEQKTDTAKKTNNTSEVSTSEETGTINDIKNEIKLQIKEQAQKEGIQLTDEEIEKLALYQMYKNMEENLSNDPALREELKKAIDSINDPEKKNELKNTFDKYLD